MGKVTEFCGVRLSRADTSLQEAVDSSELKAALDIMRPRPSPRELIRLGGSGDGAYLVPDDIFGIKACFSPGVNNYKFFEDELADDYGIECHMIDYSSDIENFATPIRPGLQTFEKKWLDIDGRDDSISLENWIDKIYPNISDDLILQIDIEGAEYRNIINATDNTLSRFRIIIIEIHSLSAMLNPEVFAQVFRPFFEKIGQNFVCVHAHPNNCCGEFFPPGIPLNVPNVHELTFLRRDRFGGSQGTLHAVQLPHPLDVVRNVPSSPPLFLNEGWLEGGIRSPNSRLKMLEDIVDYQSGVIANTSTRQEAEKITLYEICKKIAKADPPPQGEIADVAKGKPFALSSNFHGFPASGLVGDEGDFFFHTDFGSNQFITIDLGQSFCIQTIVLKNRLDGFRSRANFLFYVLHDRPGHEGHTAQPLQIEDDFTTGANVESITSIPSMSSRYITIISPCYTALHFSAIRVMAAVKR